MKSDEIEEEKSSNLSNLLKLEQVEEEKCDPVQFKVSSVNNTHDKVKGMTEHNSTPHDIEATNVLWCHGVQRYDSYKYPIFEKLTTQQLGSFWRPEEVSLESRGDCQSNLNKSISIPLTSSTRLCLTLSLRMVLGWLCTLLQLPELEACMEVWGL